MRAVTFSKPEVIRRMNEKFVVTWFNQAADLFPAKPAGPNDCQPQVSQHYLDSFPDGGGGANVKIFFCTPQGRIVHFIQGHYRPSTFLEEMDFATKLLASNTSGDSKRFAPVLAKAHRERRQALAKQRELAGTAEPAADVRAHRLLIQLFHLRERNHETALTRLLRDPKEYMVNESFAIA